MRFFTRLAIASLFSVGGLPAIGQPADNPVVYHKAITRLQLDLLQKNIYYISKLSRTESARQMEERRLALVAQGEAAVATCRQLPACRGNTELRTRAVRAFQAMVGVYGAPYQQVNELAAKRAESFEAMQRYWGTYEKAQQRLVGLGDSVQEARERFANDLDLRPESNASLNKQTHQWLAITRRVLALYQYEYQVFLPYFRVQLGCARLMAALVAHDAAGFEAARQLLAAEAATSAAELAAVPEFEELDVAYRNAAREVVNFQAVMCAGEFVQAAALMAHQDQLRYDEAQALNSCFQVYSRKNQKVHQDFARAAAEFTRTHSPSLNGDPGH